MAGEGPGALARELSASLEACSTPEARAWLEAELCPGGAFARGAFFGRYAGVSRRFPGPLIVAAETAARLHELGLCAPERVSAAELARASLLLAACAVLPDGAQLALAIELFRRGDNLERIALLRALPLLPEPEGLVELAV